MGVPRAFAGAQSRVGRPSGLGLRPRAATALCRFAAGSGQHRAPARPPVLPNARQEIYLSIYPFCANLHTLGIYRQLPTVNRQLVHLNCSPGCRRDNAWSRSCFVKAATQEGVPENAEGARRQGDTSPTYILFYHQLFNFSTLFSPHPSPSANIPVILKYFPPSAGTKTAILPGRLRQKTPSTAL